MTDIDFDELDRAVQSLTSSSDITPAASNQVDGVPTTDSSEPSSNSTPSSSETIPAQIQPSPAHTDNQSATTAPSASSTIIPPRRPSGRFMDVVHPSSDMRSRQPVKRQGLHIEPISDVAPEVQPADTVSQDSGMKDDAQPTVESVRSSESPDSHRATSHNATEMIMPDPIDFLSQKDTTPTPEADSSAEIVPEAHDEVEQDSIVRDDMQVDLPENSHDDPISSPEETNQPLETPFISNPKVEKRPLGAPNIEDASGEYTLDETTPDQKDEAIETPLPAELHQDILALESDETVGDTSHLETGAANRSETLSSSTKIEEHQKSPSSDNNQETGTGHQPGAIYDTKSYHQPLQHPTKKHTGWLVVLWILLLIAVGAGVGAALYFFVLT